MVRLWADGRNIGPRSAIWRPSLRPPCARDLFSIWKLTLDGTNESTRGEHVKRVPVPLYKLSRP